MYFNKVNFFQINPCITRLFQPIKKGPVNRFFLLVLVSWIRCQRMRWFGIEAIAKMDAVRRFRRMRDKLPRNLQSATPARVQKSSKMAAFYFVYKRLCESVCKDIRIANISPYTDFYATPFSRIETVFFSGLISAITP